MVGCVYMSPLKINAANRLCNACGLCCNGVMFHTVQLQPGDVPQALVALGLRIKRKKGHSYILQPCPAYRESCCSIYPSRPERCRLFECQQLKRLAAEEITEMAALEKIGDVRQRVRRINALLERAGTTNEKRPLSKRCEKIMAEPLHASSEAETVKLHQELTREMEALEVILDEHFRVTKEDGGKGEI